MPLLRYSLPSAILFCSVRSAVLLTGRCSFHATIPSVVDLLEEDILHSAGTAVTLPALFVLHLLLLYTLLHTDCSLCHAVPVVLVENFGGSVLLTVLLIYDDGVPRRTTGDAVVVSFTGVVFTLLRTFCDH